MRILITGSRNWDQPEVIKGALTIGQGLLQFGATRPTLVHGGAPGADTIAAHIAARHGWAIEEHPANWAKYGKQAGYLRNQEMVDLGADICLAFIKDHSRGATMCADLADAAGIPVWRCET